MDALSQVMSHYKCCYYPTQSAIMAHFIYHMCMKVHIHVHTVIIFSHTSSSMCMYLISFKLLLIFVEIFVLHCTFRVYYYCVINYLSRRVLVEKSLQILYFN